MPHLCDPDSLISPSTMPIAIGRGLGASPRTFCRGIGFRIFQVLAAACDKHGQIGYQDSFGFGRPPLLPPSDGFCAACTEHERTVMLTDMIMSA